MKRRDWGDLLAAVFALAIIGLMVRPNSLGPGFVRSLGTAMTSLVSFVSDSGTGGAGPAPAAGGTVYA